jgi:hypothetical protein
MSGLSQKGVSENSPAAERTNLYSGHANVYLAPQWTRCSQFALGLFLAARVTPSLEENDPSAPPSWPGMMVWTAPPRRHQGAKTWSQERHKEGDRP